MEHTLQYSGNEIDQLLNKIDNITNTPEDIDNGINKINDIFNLIYPIGAIYISVNSTNPSLLFGGAWKQIKDTFLLAAGDNFAAGAIGGETEVALTNASQNAPHQHFVKFDANNKYIGIDIGGAAVNESVYLSSGVLNEGGRSGTLLADLSGSGDPHNNMPPYLAVYIWQRIEGSQSENNNQEETN